MAITGLPAVGVDSSKLQCSSALQASACVPLAEQVKQKWLMATTVPFGTTPLCEPAWQ